jgi:deoxyribodipyrimidine photo-lyase
MSQQEIRSLGLWWLRQDLRTADNEALEGARRQVDALLPVFCFDPRDFKARREAPEGLGVPKVGPPRCRCEFQSQ